ncbi:MAG: hypothetical protein K1X53_09930 [Candidatus Sumerlaeaceae bacterium]|nr:hypothetical protein [Candidatus Sumerlaeaceae bacterium]
MHPRIETSFKEAERFHATFLDYSKVQSFEEFETVAKDLADFRAALKTLGDPHLKFSTLHIAGSKGKGSTSSHMASVLRHAGKRTGFLISPHLLELTERITVDGVEISREAFGELTARLRGILPDGPDQWHTNPLKRMLQGFGLIGPPEYRRIFRNAHGYFNGAAFLHFVKSKVDFAVIETGMGGRLDNTNVFDRPPEVPGGVLVTAITSMALEHRMSLGNDIRQITGHKAGIIRPHGLAVLGPQKPEWYEDVRDVVQARCREIGAPPVLDANTTLKIVPGSENFTAEGTEAVFQTDEQQMAAWLAAVGAPADGGGAAELVAALRQGQKFRSPLAGAYQADNLRTVLGCCVALGVRGVPLTVQQIRVGLESTQWPGRFEIISRDPLIIADCSHESLSIEAFARSFREFYGDRPVIAVVGFLRDNNIPRMCRAMIPHLALKHVVCCKPNLPIRALGAKKAIRIAEPVLGVPMTAIDHQVTAIRRAYDMRSGNEALLIFSDIYIVGEARRVIPGWLRGEK